MRCAPRAPVTEVPVHGAPPSRYDMLGKSCACCGGRVSEEQEAVSGLEFEHDRSVRLDGASGLSRVRAVRPGRTGRIGFKKVRHTPSLPIGELGSPRWPLALQQRCEAVPLGQLALHRVPSSEIVGRSGSDGASGRAQRSSTLLETKACWRAS